MTYLPAIGQSLDLAAVLAALLLLGSCAHHKVVMSRETASARTSALEQLGYADHASFGTCSPPDCPIPTRKTLGSASASPALQAARPALRPATAIAPPDAVPQTSTKSLANASPFADDALPQSTSQPKPAATRRWIVPFAFGKSVLGPAGARAVQEAIGALPTGIAVSLSGRTDDLGPPSFNETLARARAETVRELIMRARPDLAEWIAVDAAGSCCFLVPNDSAQDRSLNRRVEILAGPPRPPH